MVTTVSTNNTTELDGDLVDNSIKTAPSNNPNTNVNSNSAKLTQNIAKTVTSLPNISPDWTYRRKLIFLSMYFTASCFACIVLADIFIVIYGTINPTHGSIDLIQANLLDSMAYALGLFATSVIGAYCFGASYEHMNYRSGVMQMVSKIATAGKKDDTTDEDKDKQ